MKKLLFTGAILIALTAALFLLRTPDTDPAQMREKYANEQSSFAESAQSLRVHYRDQGNPTGAAIVLLHGNSSSLHTWEPLVERLGGDFRVVTLTLPGHGLTGPNADHDYSFAGMSEAVDAVVDELGLNRFVLGGNSMGGWLAWRYALANPDKVDVLILLDASGMPLREGETEPPLNLGFRLLKNPAGRFVIQRFTPRSAVKKSALQSVSVKSVVTDDVVDRYWELLRLPGNRRAAAERARADREIQYSDRVGEITAPTLIIWGKEDQLIYASAAQTFKERLPHSEVRIYEGVGHLPMEEAPDRTAQDIETFLAGALREN